MIKHRILKTPGVTALVLAGTLGLGGCDNSLTESPPHILVADNLFNDNAGFEAAVNGLYALVREDRMGAISVSSVNDLRNEMWALGTDVAWGLY